MLLISYGWELLFDHISFLFQLKAFDNAGKESRKLTQMKDKKFLEGLAHDKRYLEHIVGQLSISATTRNNNPETNSTTRLMLSEVNKLILIAIISYITRLLSIWESDMYYLFNINLQAKKGLEFLMDRREFWSQQRPEYPDDAKEIGGKPEGWDAVMTSVVKKKHGKMFGRKLL